MRFARRLVLAALAGAVLVSGCALRDPRDSYAYGRTDGLWDADYDFLLDWRFPTTASEGPLLPVQRFRPGRPAIGVPWATGNPLVPRDADLAPPLEPTADTAATTHDETDDVAPALDDPASAGTTGPLARVGIAGDARARGDVDPGR